MAKKKSLPLYSLTIEEFTKLLDERIVRLYPHASSSTKSTRKTVQIPLVMAQQPAPGRFVYGLRGIEQLFGVSHKTAQYYKDHIITKAVRQNGRKIVVDVAMALKLFDEKKSKDRRN